MIKRIVLLVACWAGHTPGAWSAEPWQETAYLQQAFEEVALRSEYTSAPQAVRKWRKPVKVWLVHHVDQAETHARLVRDHLNHLARLTGQTITLADSAAEANMTIVFSHLQLWRNDIALVSGSLTLKPPQDAACMFGLDLDASKAIRRAWVVIPVDHAQEHRLLLSCIVEEITQAMGLPNDSDKVYPSIFNDKTPETLLTGLDALLLKMLYHPRIKVGMRAAQVRPILADILQQWQADGSIENAERMVRQSPLYEMMGF